MCGVAGRNQASMPIVSGGTLFTLFCNHGEGGFADHDMEECVGSWCCSCNPRAG